jgi:glycosyltransferase involved in cell wall biosynthesis
MVAPSDDDRTMGHTVAAVMTTLGRPTLRRALDSINSQSFKVSRLIVKQGPGDTISKMSAALKEIDSDLVVWLDDDAVYPEDWIKSLEEVFEDEQVAYAAGSCLPLTLIDENSTDAEKCIAEVTSTFFGTMNMSQRHKLGKKIEDRDETNLMGSGMYRASVMKEIFKEPEKVPPGFSETYIIQRMRMMGYRTLYVPSGFFYHKQRSNIFSFSRQIYRSGVGRMNFFVQFPKEGLKKFYTFAPMVFLVYLLAFFGLAFVNLPISNLPLIAYVVLLMLMSFGFNKYKTRWLWLYYLTMHLSYGFGMLVGLFKSKVTWT